MAEYPVGGGPERRSQVRRQTEVGDHVQLPVRVVSDDRPAWRRHPVVRLADEPIGNLLGIERLVGFPDGLDDGIAVVETSAKGADVALEPGREIGPPAAAGSARRDVKLRGIGFTDGNGRQCC